MSAYNILRFHQNKLLEKYCGANGAESSTRWPFVFIDQGDFCVQCKMRGKKTKQWLGN